MNQKLKKLIRQLGEAIHETVSESEDIAGVVKDIREQGFDVLLMLEATIGLNEMDEAEKAASLTESGGAENSESEAPFNSHDLTFLKSLRITLGDGTGEVDPADPAPTRATDSTEDSSGEASASNA